MALSFNETETFLRGAIGEKAHKRKPAKVTEDQWVRMMNILGIYYGSQASTTDIARMYGFTNRERPTRLITNGMRWLWVKSSPDVRPTNNFGDLVLFRQGWKRRFQPHILEPV